MEWLQARGRLVSRGVVVRLQKWLPRENIVVLGKFRRGCIELRGLPFHLWNENQLRFILKNLEKVTKVDQLRKWLPRENIVVLGKFRRGCIELWGLPFHLWNENQLRFILKNWEKMTKVDRDTLKLIDLSNKG